MSMEKIHLGRKTNKNKNIVTSSEKESSQTDFLKIDAKNKNIVPVMTPNYKK